MRQNGGLESLQKVGKIAATKFRPTNPQGSQLHTRNTGPTHRRTTLSQVVSAGCSVVTGPPTTLLLTISRTLWEEVPDG